MANAYTLRVKEAQMNERMRELEAKLGRSLMSWWPIHEAAVAARISRDWGPHHGANSNNHADLTLALY